MIAQSPERSPLLPIPAPDGSPWIPVAIPRRGAHLRMGAVMGFRPAEAAEAEPIPTSIQFNSLEAAELAFRQMGDKEMQRRLELAWIAAGLGTREA